jgi:small subunit ribosomal protein S16
VGTYNPLTDPATVNVDAAKVAKWLNQGAQLTPKAAQLLQKAGVSLERPQPAAA